MKFTIVTSSLMYKWMTLVFVLMFVNSFTSSAQMPPPGFERAKKMEEERMKMMSIDRDTMTLIDTVMIYDPETYETETRIVEHRISIRDYCVTILGMSNPEVLMDGQPHTIIDPRTYEDLTIRLTPKGTLEVIPK